LFLHQLLDLAFKGTDAVRDIILLHGGPLGSKPPTRHKYGLIWLIIDTLCLGY
jgi:hypothetical protein